MDGMDTSHIKKIKHLTQNNFEKLFQNYFKDPNLKVKRAYNEELETGDHYSAEIKTMIVEFEGQKDPIRIFIKAPLGNFLGKVQNELMKFFTRETFWYMEAYPALVSKYPEIKNLSPKCFLARSAYDQDYRQLLSWKHNNGIICLQSYTYKADKGLIIMEDLKDPNRSEGPLKSVNKSVPPTLEVAKVIMKSLATFHGVWFAWLHEQDPAIIGGLTKDEFLKAFAPMKFEKFMMKAPFKIIRSLESQMTLLGKPKELLDALRNYRKQTVYEDVNKIRSPDSKLLTIVHGDVWSNNFFINEEETELTFIDFQGLCPSHPGQDFWWYIYNQTDCEWRKDNLDDCLKTYFETIEKYFQKANFQMTFDEFRTEMMSKRGFGFAMSFFVLPGMIDSNNHFNQFNDGTFRSMNEILKLRKTMFAKPMTEDADPSILEINRRLLENIEEAFELGLLK